MDFERDVQTFIEQNVAKFELELRDLAKAEADRRRAAKADAAAAALALADRAQSMLEVQLADEKTNRHRFEVLCGEAVRVQVTNEVLTIHLSVLSQLTYFQSYLERWANSPKEVIALNLPSPCTIDDLLALLHHLYGFEIELPSLGSALRVSLVASVLGASDVALNELSGSIARLARNSDDEAAVRLFLSHYELPGIFAGLCVEGEVPMSAEDLKAMAISAAKAPDTPDGTTSRAVVASAVGARSGVLAGIQLAPRSLDTLNGLHEVGLRWLLTLQEACDAKQADAFYTWASTAQHRKGLCDLDAFRSHAAALLQEGFANHLRKNGSTDAIRIGASRECREGYHKDNYNFPNVLFAGSATVVHSALPAAIRRERTVLLESVAPEDLASILDPEVLSALRRNLPATTQLCKHTDAVKAWVQAGKVQERMAALTIESRRVAIAAVARHLGDVQPELVQALQHELA